MKTSDLIQAMSDAGAPMEAILIALRAIEEGQEEISARRAADRDRKRHQRALAKERDGTVMGQSQDTDGTVTETPSLSRPPNENNSNPPTHTHPNTKTPARGCRLPGAWEPKPLPADLVKSVAAWPAGAIERELARFRDWAASATGRVAVKKDWDAAWRNWLRKCEDEGKYRANGTGLHRTRDGNRTMQEIAEQLAHE